MTPDLPRGMAADVIALERAEQEFERRHGDEARERWSALGAGGAGVLEDQQLEVLERNGPEAAAWDAFAWELKERIGLLESERAELRSKGGSG